MSGPRNLAWLWTLAVVQGAMIAWLAFQLLGDGEVVAAPIDDPAQPTATRSGIAEVPSTVATGGLTDAAPRAPEIAAPPSTAVVPTHAVLFGRVAGKGSKQPRQGTIAVHAGDATKPAAQTSILRDSVDYAVPGLAPGSYRLRVRASGFRDHDEAIEVAPGTDRVRADVTLVPSWELRVQIVGADGRPLHEGFAELAKQHPHLWPSVPIAVATATEPPAVLPATDLRESDIGIGRWRGGRGGFDPDTVLPKRFSGYLELPQDRPLYVSAVMRTAVLATERVEAGQEEVTLTVPFERALGSLGTVRLQVVDSESGQPIAGARVALTDSQSGQQGQLVDADGKIELRYQRPGLLNVDILAKDRAAPLWNVEVEPGASVDLGPVPVYPPVELKAVLVDAPAGAEASVALTVLDPPPHPALRARGAHVGGARGGTFSARIAPGRYRLRATAAGRLAVMECDTRKLGGEPLRVQMHATAKLRVRPAAEQRVQFVVRDAAGTPHFRRWLSWTSAFDLELLPGEYSIELTPWGGTASQRSLVLGASGAELDLR